MLIAIEGCIGAGKTTVAQGLAAHRGSSPLLEAFEANPFLRAFSANPSAHALETEFAFLLIHFHQMKGIRVADTEVISDFHLGKDLLFEQMNLSDTRTATIFRSLYDVCVEQVPSVDLMICLSASDALIIDRIRLRRREFELEFKPEYFVRLNRIYEDFFAMYSGAKLVVPMDEYDFVRSPQLFDVLSNSIDTQPHRSLS